MVGVLELLKPQHTGPLSPEYISMQSLENINEFMYTTCYYYNIKYTFPEHPVSLSVPNELILRPRSTVKLSFEAGIDLDALNAQYLANAENYLMDSVVGAGSVDLVAQFLEFA